MFVRKVLHYSKHHYWLQIKFWNKIASEQEADIFPITSINGLYYSAPNITTVLSKRMTSYQTLSQHWIQMRSLAGIYVSPGSQHGIQTSRDLLPLGKHECNLCVTAHYVCFLKWAPSWRSTHIPTQTHLWRWHGNTPETLISLVLHCNNPPPICAVSE